MLKTFRKKARARAKIPLCFILGENLHFLHEERSRHLDVRVEVRTVSDVNCVACMVKHIGCTALNSQLSSLWTRQTVCAHFIECNVMFNVTDRFCSVCFQFYLFVLFSKRFQFSKCCMIWKKFKPNHMAETTSVKLQQELIFVMFKKYFVCNSHFIQFPIFRCWASLPVLVHGGTTANKERKTGQW